MRENGFRQSLLSRIDPARDSPAACCLPEPASFGAVDPAQFQRRHPMSEPAPERGPRHEALEVFVGRWKAEGTAFGESDRPDDPRANGQRWESTHHAYWHTGGVFL